MAVNKPVGDNARKGAVKKRTQLKTKLGGVTAWTKRSKASGEFMAPHREKGRQEIQGCAARILTMADEEFGPHPPRGHTAVTGQRSPVVG
jgi:hypothetical protein